MRQHSAQRKVELDAYRTGACVLVADGALILTLLCLASFRTHKGFYYADRAPALCLVCTAGSGVLHSHVACAPSANPAPVPPRISGAAGPQYTPSRDPAPGFRSSILGSGLSSMTLCGGGAVRPAVVVVVVMDRELARRRL